jgi:hemolysin D
MPAVQLNRHKRSDSNTLISFESATAEVLARPHIFAKRSVLYVLAALVVSIFVFISVAKLDRVVSTTGRVVPVTGVVTVQPLEKSIISSILVSVGDAVKKGQVLATLDATFVQADVVQSQQKMASLRPQQRRLAAEEAGKLFHPDPAQPYDALQDSLWKQRKTQFDSAVMDFDQRINSTEAQAAGLRQASIDYHARLKIASETERMYSQLVKESLAGELQLLTAQDQKLEIERQINQTDNTLVATEHQLESLKEQRKVYIDQWHNDNLNNLVSVQNELDQTEDTLKKAAKLKDLSTLVAPVDGIVLKIPSLTAGGVAGDAQPLFSLMPSNAALEVDAQIETKDSGFVKIGDPVKIKFETYRFLEHGTAEGVVRTVSQDAFTEQATQDVVSMTAANSARTPYFAARIKITSVKLHDVPPDFRLVPGMTLQADIVVGRRTIMWYLLGGALRSGAESMREP